MGRRPTRRKDYAPVVGAELDLHGCTAYEAVDAVRTFLAEERAAGTRRVRIIVGKGRHSTGGPVLPDAVKALLVREGYTYTYAKLALGGDGALEVTL